MPISFTRRCRRMRLRNDGRNDVTILSQKFLSDSRRAFRPCNGAIVSSPSSNTRSPTKVEFTPHRSNHPPFQVKWINVTKQHHLESLSCPFTSHSRNTLNNGTVVVLTRAGCAIIPIVTFTYPAHRIFRELISELMLPSSLGFNCVRLPFELHFPVVIINYQGRNSHG